MVFEGRTGGERNWTKHSQGDGTEGGRRVAETREENIEIVRVLDECNRIIKRREIDHVTYFHQSKEESGSWTGAQVCCRGRPGYVLTCRHLTKFAWVRGMRENHQLRPRR